MDARKAFAAREFRPVQVVDHDLNEEHNRRLSDLRGIDDRAAANFAPTLSFRPRSTKYSFMHVLDQPDPDSIQATRAVQDGAAAPYRAFDPTAQHAPPAAFLSSIDVESAIQNRGLVALQRATKADYLPSLESPMYHGTRAMPTGTGLLAPRPLPAAAAPDVRTTHAGWASRVKADQIQSHPRAFGMATRGGRG